MILAFLYISLDQKKVVIRFSWYLAAAAAFASQLYMILYWQELARRLTAFLPMDYVFGFITIVLLLIAAKKYTGIWLPLVAVIFIAYAYFGPSLVGVFRFTPISLRRYLSTVYIGGDGIYGSTVGTSATFVFMFVLFGEFLLKLGAGQFIIDMAQSVCGRVRGGSAKIAVVASGLFGMVSGSPMANVSTTGSLTIPLMKKSGYSPEFSAGIVATAATGGQIMPPVMGAAAFIMADLINTTYATVCLAATLTGILYYVALFIMVDLEALKYGLKGIPADQIPNWKVVFRNGWHYTIALVVLVYLMLALQWSASKAAFWSIVVLCLVHLGKKILKGQPIEWKKLLDIMVDAAQGSIGIAVACACAGIIVGTFVATGLNLRFSTLLVNLAGGSLPLLLIFSMIAALILGMGLSATPVYILLSVLVVPAITSFGVSRLAAHMFVFYFGSIAPITPPVGLAFYVSAGLAQAKPMKTGLYATMLAIAGFIFPFIFIYSPALLMQGSVFEIAWAAVTSLIGVISLAIALEGYFRGKINTATRILLFVGAIITIIPEIYSTTAGLIIVVAVMGWNFYSSRRKLTGSE
jgi:TRAP transporter 4TM/12TM fusion protein